MNKESIGPIVVIWDIDLGPITESGTSGVSVALVHGMLIAQNPFRGHEDAHEYGKDGDKDGQ